jgi:chromosome segregation ATPase
VATNGLDELPGCTCDACEQRRANQGMVSENATLRREVDDLRAQRVRLLDELNTKAAGRHKLRTERDRALTELTRVSGELAQEKRGRNALAAECASSRERLSVLQAQVDELSVVDAEFSDADKAAELQKELAAERNAHALTKERLEKVRAELESGQNALSTSRWQARQHASLLAQIKRLIEDDEVPF